MKGLEGVYPPEENPSKGLEGAYPPNGISSKGLVGVCESKENPSKGLEGAYTPMVTSPKGLTVGYAMQDILKNAKTRVITTIQRDIFLIYENLIAIL